MTAHTSMKMAVALLTLATVSAMKAPEWSWDDSLLRPPTELGSSSWFRHTSPMSSDQNQWEALKNGADSAENNSSLADGSVNSTQSRPSELTVTTPTESSGSSEESSSHKGHWESLKNAAVSQRNNSMSETGDSSTSEETASSNVTRSSSEERDHDGLAELNSSSSTDREHLLYSAHEVHDYPGHEEHTDVEEEAAKSGETETNASLGGQSNTSDTSQDEPAELTPAEALNEAVRDHNPTGELESVEHDEVDVSKDVFVVTPDADDLGENEIDETDSSNEKTKVIKLTSGGLKLEEMNESATTRPERENVNEAESSATATHNIPSNFSEVTGLPETDIKTISPDNHQTEETPDQLNFPAPENGGDLVVGETRADANLGPNLQRPSAPSSDQQTSPSLTPGYYNSAFSLGGTTTTVTITDRRLDDTDYELQRLLQDASRSTTVSITSPDFSNGTFIAAKHHSKQNPWLQRYAPFFYPENPVPETVDTLEQRHEPAAELRRLRIEHLVLVPPSSYPEEVLRTVHDAKLRALPRPQEEVHVHLGQAEEERKPTVQELARGAEYVSQEEVKGAVGGSDVRKESGAPRLAENPFVAPNPGVVSGGQVHFGRVPSDVDQPPSFEHQNGALLDRPASEHPSGPVDVDSYSDYSRPRPEDIVPNHTGPSVNLVPPAHRGTDSFSRPKPEDVLAPPSHGEFDHRLPGHVPPFSGGFGAPKQRDVLQDGQHNDGASDLIRPQLQRFPKLTSITKSSSRVSSPDFVSVTGHSHPPSSASSEYSSPKAKDVISVHPTGRLISSNPSSASPAGPSHSEEQSKNGAFSPPKPHDVIPLSESFMYDRAHANAAGVPEEHQDQYGTPKPSSLVSSTGRRTTSTAAGRKSTKETTSAAAGRRKTHVEVSELAMKEVEAPEFGGKDGYRRPKLVDLLRPSGERTKLDSLPDQRKSGYGTPKPNHVVSLDGLQQFGAVLPSVEQYTEPSTESSTKKTQTAGFKASRKESGFASPRPEDVILASGEFVGLPFLSTRDHFKPDSSSDNTVVGASISAVGPTGWESSKQVTNPAPDTRENSVYYTPSAAPPAPPAPRLEPITQTASRFTPTSIYDVLESREPLGLPDIPTDSGAARRTNGELSPDSPLYADAEWRPSLSPFPEPRTADSAHRASRRLADETAEGEDRWVWPRTMRTAEVTGRVLFPQK